MDQSIATGFLEEVNDRIEAVRLLEQLGYATDKIQVVGDSVKGFCPIHRDTKFRSLVVDAGKRSFKCTIKSCPGHTGGSLIDLYALTRRTDPVVAATRLISELKLDVDPAWFDRLLESQLDAARQALEEGNDALAEEGARAALDFRPGCTEAHLLLAAIHAGRGEPEAACSEYAAAIDACLTSGQFEEGERILGEAAALYPESEDLFYLQVRAAELQGRTEDVIRLLEELAAAREAAGQALDNIGIYNRLIELQPDNPAPRLRLAAIHESRRDMRNACREMESAAMLLMKQERGSEAIPLLERILRCEPQQKRLRLALAEELIRQGDYERAREQLFEVANQQIENSEFVAAEKTVRRWLDIEPDSVETYETLARIFQEQERLSEAADALRQAAEAATRTNGVNAAIPLLFRIKFLQPEDAALRQELVEKLLEANEPQRAAFELLDLAEVCFAGGDSAQAEAALKRAVTVDESIAFRLQVAEVCESHGLTDAARELLTGAATAAEAANDLPTALSALARLVELAPDDLDMAGRRVSLLWQHDWREAAAATAPLIGRLESAGQTDKASGFFQQALEQASRLTASGAGSANAFHLLFESAYTKRDASAAAVFYAALGDLRHAVDLQAARQWAGQMVELEPEHEAARSHLAQLSLALGERAQATEAFLELATLEEKRGDIDAALESLDQAALASLDRPEILKRKATLVESRSGLAEAAPVFRDYLLCLKTCSPDEALVEYQAYLERQPDDTVARRHLADLLAESGRRDEATASYMTLLQAAEAKDDRVEVLQLRERLLALDPENPELQASLAASLRDAGDSSRSLHHYRLAARGYLDSDRAAEAIQTARKALEENRGDVELLELLLEAAERESDAATQEEALAQLAADCRDLGQFDDALVRFRRLVELRPDVPSYQHDLAEILELSGETDEALVEWIKLARLLDTSGDPSGALGVYRRIDEGAVSDLETLQHWVTLAQGSAGSPADAVRALAALTLFHLDSGSGSSAEEILGQLLRIASGSPAEAGPRLDRIAERMGRSPEAAPVLLCAADCYETLGQRESAVESLNRAVEATPDNVDAHQRLVEIHTAEGRTGEAFDHHLAILRGLLVGEKPAVWQGRLKELRELAAGQSRMRLALATVLLKSGNEAARTEAVVELESTVRAAVEQGDSECVLAACETAPEAAAASPVMWQAKVDVLVAAGDLDEAGTWLHQCTCSALEEGLPEEAERAAARWLEILPTDPDALELNASIQRQLGRDEDALRFYLEAAQSWRANAEFQNAARTLRQAAEISPDPTAPRQLLCQVLLEGGYMDEAIAEIRSLAETLVELERFDEAESLLHDALKRQPDSPDTVRILAAAIYRRDGFEAALPHFRRQILLRRHCGSAAEVVADYEAILALEGATVDLRAEYADYLEETGQEESAKRQLLEVAKLFRDEARDLVKAVEYYGRATAVAHSTDDAPVFEELAALHLELKVPAFAAGALREAARLYDLAGRSAAAIQCARQALELSEGTQRIEDEALLGTLLTRSGKASEGATHLREALAAAESSPEISAERCQELCAALLEADPTDLKTAEKYLHLLPENELPNGAVTLARRFARHEKFNEQVHILKLARSIAPASLEIRRELTEGLARAGDDPEKLQRELIELCEMAAKAREQELASETLAKLEQLPGVSDSPLLLAPLYALTGDTDNAVARYTAAAEAFAEEQRFDDAADALSSAMDLDAGAVPVATVATLVRSSEAAGPIRALAQRLLESAIRARSRTRALVITTALLEHSSVEEGRKILRAIAQGAGAAFVVAVAGAHADWLNERERSDEATALAGFITDLVPNSPEAWWLASQLHRKAGRGQEAADAALKAARLFNEAGAVTEEETCYRQALEQFPNNIPVLETLAYFYDREKRVGDALGVMRRLARLTADAGDHQTAANWLRKILAYAPNDDESREQIAEVLLQLKRTDEAAGHLLELARACAKKGDDEKAERTYERLLEVEPDNEQAAAYLLDRASRRDDQAAIARYTIAMATVKAESGALNQASQMLRNLLIREPDNLMALEKLAAFCRRAQDIAGFRSATMSLGQKLFQRRDYMGAILQFEALLEIQPQDLEVLQMLVDACTAEGMLERGADFAQQMLETARDVADMRRIVTAANAILAYDSTRASVRRELAEALLCLNRITEAVAEWSRAAEEYVVSGDLLSAAECCRRITQVTPSNLPAWKRLADLLAFADQPQQAREAYLHLAGAYAESGDRPAAVAVLNQLSDLDSNDPLPHERLLELHLQAGSHKEAIEEILWLVRHHMRNNDLASAERLIERGVGIDPESLTLQQCRLEIVRGLGRTDELRLRMQDLAERFKAAGDLRKAADTLEQILDMDPNQPDVRRELGGLWLQLGETSLAHMQFGRLLQEILDRSDPEEARDTAEAILRQYGDTPSLRGHLARVFTENGLQEVGGRYFALCASKAAEKGDRDSQILYLKLATQARPRWTEGLRQLAEACAQAGDTGSAFESFQRLAALLTDSKQFNEAASAIRRQISLRPKDPAPRIQLVELYTRIGDRENRGAALQDLADLYVSRGQTDEAVAVYRQIIDLRPDDPDVLQRFVELFAQVGNELEIVDEYLRLAEALTKKGAFVEATQTYEQILAIDRRNPVIREKFISFLQNHGQKGRALAEMRRLADTYISRGNRAAAVNVLVGALAMSPRDPELCLRLAAAYEAVGNHEAATQSYARAASLLADTAPIRAIDLYRKMLEKDPQNTEIRRRLAEAYARAGEQSRAASQARKLAEIHASRGELEQAEAAYRLASANKPESLSALRDAIQLHAHDPMLQYVDLERYGDALMAAGHTDEALDQYRKARALHDDRPRLIQKCIDALCQIAPEREAIPDMLTLAERYLTAGDAAAARNLYERVLRLDPSCVNAKAGRDAAFKLELVSTQPGGTSAPNPLDQQPLRSAHSQKKARVGMNDLLGAFGDDNATGSAGG